MIYFTHFYSISFSHNELRLYFIDVAHSPCSLSILHCIKTWNQNIFFLQYTFCVCVFDDGATMVEMLFHSSCCRAGAISFVFIYIVFVMPGKKYIIPCESKTTLHMFQGHATIIYSRFLGTNDFMEVIFIPDDDICRCLRGNIRHWLILERSMYNKNRIEGRLIYRWRAMSHCDLFSIHCRYRMLIHLSSIRDWIQKIRYAYAVQDLFLPSQSKKIFPISSRASNLKRYYALLLFSRFIRWNSYIATRNSDGKETPS